MATMKKTTEDPASMIDEPTPTSPASLQDGACAVFVDKDGTLVEDLPNNVDPARLNFTSQAIEGLQLLARSGYRIVVVTNEPGIAFNLFDRAALTRLEKSLTTRLAEAGIPLAGFFACPHAPAAPPAAGCLCRKPSPGLLRQAARQHGLSLANSWMIGDLLDDVEAGRRAGCRTVLLDVDHETAWRMSPLRTPHYGASDLLHAAQLILRADGSARKEAVAPQAADDEQTLEAP
jgi:D-glycero-D-manno-heptose 1,7-bisphosphate phosphatase